MDYLENLKNIHKSLKFEPQNQLNLELPEQLMIVKHLCPNDIVLELGGSIGRASCVINSLLENKKHHVVIEPSKIESEKLKINRDLNSLEFSIETAAISKHKLYSKGWYTYKSKINGSVEVDIISFNELKEKYNLNYNVLVIDNEGHFVDNLREFPDILENIRKLQIEHDFNSEEDLIFFNNTMNNNGFKMVDKFLKNEKYGPGINWADGVKTDPIFVSVWKK